MQIGNLFVRLGARYRQPVIVDHAHIHRTDNFLHSLIVITGGAVGFRQARAALSFRRLKGRFEFSPALRNAVLYR